LKSLIKLGSKFVVGIILLIAFVYFGIQYVIPRLEEKDKKDNRDVKENVVKPDNNYYPVTKVFDGDTYEVEIEGKKEKVRLLGIDTPEKWESNKLNKDVERSGSDKKTIKTLGDMASNYAKKLVSGKRVLLEADPTNDDRDRYGRLLRYVYLEDGTFVNLKLVEDGYANAYTKFPITKKDEFLKAERNARENKRGLWGDIEGLKYMGNQ
jgi:micrococcal nuclease